MKKEVGFVHSSLEIQEVSLPSVYPISKDVSDEHKYVRHDFVYAQSLYKALDACVQLLFVN